MRGIAVGAAALGAALALAACGPMLAPGDPLSGLKRAERQRFERGAAVFDRVFTPQTGLGPLFNSVACGECHEEPVAGGGGDEDEVNATLLRPDGSCDLLVEKGGPVFQTEVTAALRQALGIEREPIPADVTVQARRSSPALFGRGLLDAVPDAEILSRSDPDDRDGNGISGRVNLSVDGRIGRFGRKGHSPTLFEFNAGAFAIEQGITSPAVPTEESIGGQPVPPGVDPTSDPEIDQETLELADAFTRFLAPPTPLKLRKQGRRGRDLFEKIGCTACHAPALRTGDAPERALRNREFAPYTDLLLHDMGPDLADICQGIALPSEFRTEPLMGLRLLSRFLHDGRAGSVEEAIELHGGEAAGARDRFRALPAADRAALVAFLRSL